MSTVDSHRILEAAVTADEELRVSEAASLGVLEASGGSIFREDGAVKIHIMRPCEGKGRGSHVYEADMLSREAPKFKGWPMYIDHEPPEVTRRNGGLPPSIFKLGGEVLESWWDPNVPASGRFGKGSVDAWVLPSPWMKPVVEAHPRLIGASVNTFATGVTARRGSGGVKNVVEGFVDDGSVDWVTKAGAGGGIDTSVLESVMEAYLETDQANTDVAEWLRQHRPAVVEALIKTPTPTKSGGDQEDTVDPKELVEAFNALSAEQRQEVATAILGSDAGTDAVTEAVDERLKAVLPTVMEAAGAEVERAALAKVDERLGRGDLRTAARARLEEAGLTDAFRDDAWAVLEALTFEAVKADDDGKGAKTAREVMEAAVDQQVGRVKKLQEAAGVKPQPRRRTGVTGDGGGEHVQEATEYDDEDDRGDGWARTLVEAGIAENEDDALAVYGVPVGKKDDKDDKGGGGGE